MSALTLGSVLCDELSAPDETRARVLALEAGRHPTLDELHAALGSDVDLTPALAVGRLSWPSSADDAALADAIDAAYAAIASTRAIVIEIRDDGPHALPRAEAVAVSHDEHLRLFVIARNQTDAGVKFSAECHGEGFGGYLEPHRGGSATLDLGPVPPGKYLMPVLVVAGGRPLSVDVAIACA